MVEWLHRGLLWISVAAASWLGMMAVHELGHVLAATATGGAVARLVLDPRTISRTEVSPNPEPLIVAWVGPVFGAIVPVGAWIVLMRWRFAALARFFAGFCLIANGAYLGFGALDRLGDAGDIQRHGSPAWTLWLFGAVCVPAGFWLWHGQGRHFGMGAPTSVPVERIAVWGSLFAAIALAGLGMFFPK